jgi:arylsulfatase A-like enzyme
VAHVLVASYVAARDVASAGVATSAALLGLIVLGLLLISGLDRALMSVPVAVPLAVRRATTVLLLAAVPLSLALWRWWQGRAFWPGWVPALFVAAALVIAAACVGHRAWTRLPDPDTLGRGQIVWSALSILAWMAVNGAAGTMAVVRIGTEHLHVALGFSTWICAALSALLLGARVPLARAPGRWAPLVVGLLATIAGLGLLEADRTLLAGLYPEVHVYLGVLGLLWLDSGVGLLLSLFRSLSARWLVPASVVTAAAASGAGLFVAAREDVRANLEGSPLGESFLYVTALTGAGEATAPLPPHPALDYPRHFDAPRPLTRYNILLVTIDALRADQAGGAEPNPAAPNLEALAREATVFDRAYAQGSRTAISMSSLMLGRYSANIDWELFIYQNGKIYDPQTISDEERASLGGHFVYTTMPKFTRGRLLAERLRAAGYKTVATPFAGKNEFFGKENGFHVGFDEFLDLTDKGWKAPSSDRIGKLALRQLDRATKHRPWMQWIHFYDPHESRGSSERYARMVTHVDTALGRLVKRLRDRGQWDDTVIAVIADHGEAFGEHRHKGHGSSVFEEQIRVPMIVRVPGVAPGHIQTPVAAVDLTATLAFLAGADTTALDGVNLYPAMLSGAEDAPRPIFSELHRYLSSAGKRTADLKAVILGRHKLVLDRRKKTKRLFDLEVDADETDNIAATQSETLDELTALSRSFFGNAEREHPLP